MTTREFATELFCRVDDATPDQQKHSQALLHPSEAVTLGLLFALKGVGTRAFYRWAEANLRPLFPRLPERTRLFRLLAAHRDETRRSLAQPSLLGVIDSFGIELIHPRREGRSDKQIGRKGKSSLRWIVGAKLGFVLDHLGRVVDWAVDTANVYDSAFHPLIEEHAGRMLVLGDSGFHVKATAERRDPENLKVCPRGTWPHGDRDGAVHADGHLPLEEGGAPDLVRAEDAGGLRAGGLQPVLPVGRGAGWGAG